MKIEFNGNNKPNGQDLKTSLSTHLSKDELIDIVVQLSAAIECHPYMTSSNKIIEVQQILKRSIPEYVTTAQSVTPPELMIRCITDLIKESDSREELLTNDPINIKQEVENIINIPGYGEHNWLNKNLPAS